MYSIPDNLKVLASLPGAILHAAHAALLHRVHCALLSAVPALPQAPTAPEALFSRTSSGTYQAASRKGLTRYDDHSGGLEGVSLESRQADAAQRVMSTGVFRPSAVHKKPVGANGSETTSARALRCLGLQSRDSRCLIGGNP